MKLLRSLLVLVSLTAACAPQTSQPAPAREPDPLEYQLATIERGGAVDRNDLVVARFRSLLGQLSSKFGDPPQAIGDMSVKAREMLREEGVSEGVLNIMEGMNQVLIAPSKVQQYSTFVARYVFLRKSGKSHDVTIAALQALRDRR